MAGLSTAIMPVATVTVAWLALGEHVGLVQILGMGLVMASILAYAFNKSKE
jgi:drug/metabolite transporter (DMT)-like permease